MVRQSLVCRSLRPLLRAQASLDVEGSGTGLALQALARVQGSAGSEAGTSCSSLRKVLHAAPADATLDQATALLRALEPLEQQWKNVLDSVDTCSTKLGALQEQLQATQGSADGFLQTAQGLLRRRSALEQQRKAAEAFNEAHFLDSDAEALLMHATPSSVNAAFLDALRRAGRLRELCKTELVSGPNDAALAVLEHIAQLQETALGVAFQWATQVAGVVAREQSAPDQVAAFHAALPLLSARWSYFSAITRDYLSARGAFLLREFLSTAAQTGGADPPQTVSTLLGWVHQCLVTEGDALSSMVPQAHQASRAEAAVSDGCLHLPSQLASLATPLSKSLAARLHQQMQRTAADPVSALALWDAVVFYHGQLAKALVGAGEDVPILRATDEAVAAAALQVYKASAEANRRLSEQLAPLPSDLLPPQAAVESAGALRRMLTSATVSGSGACADQRRAWPAEWCAEHRLFGVLHGREQEHSDALAPELVAFLAVSPPSSGAVDPSLMVHHAVANGTAFLLHSLHVRGSSLEEPQLCMYVLRCRACESHTLPHGKPPAPTQVHAELHSCRGQGSARRQCLRDTFASSCVGRRAGRGSAVLVPAMCLHPRLKHPASHRAAAAADDSCLRRPGRGSLPLC